MEGNHFLFNRFLYDRENKIQDEDLEEYIKSFNDCEYSGLVTLELNRKGKVKIRINYTIYELIELVDRVLNDELLIEFLDLRDLQLRKCFNGRYTITRLDDSFVELMSELLSDMSDIPKLIWKYDAIPMLICRRSEKHSYGCCCVTRRKVS